jgi:large repetitive protein
VITIQGDDFDSAQIRFSDLNLGSSNDYFDVNEAVDITITNDGKYAFVAGRNSRQLGSAIPSVDGDRRAGGNIGIIKSPLTSDIDLVAATRSIPDGWTFSTDLSQDGKSLFATYPGIGSTFIFDVDEIIKTVETPDNYTVDYWRRGIDYPDIASVGVNNPRVLIDAVFNPVSGIFNASKADLLQYPIDNINPKIAIASDLRSLTALPDRISGDISYGVLEGSKRGPVSTGGNPTGVTTVSTPRLEASLITPLTATQDLTPTFQWRLNEDLASIKEINLFISAYPEREGLLPWDRFVDLSDSGLFSSLTIERKRELLSKQWNGSDDFNSGRILTATWKNESGSWYQYDRETSFGRTWATGDAANSMTSFTLPEELRLSAGQNIYWAIQAIREDGITDIDFGEFATASVAGDTPFSSVTLLTHGFTLSPSSTGIPESHYEMADHIARANGAEAPGLILRYHKPTGNWIPVDKSGNTLNNLVNGLSPESPNYLERLASAIKLNYLHKPLVLLPEWSKDRESIIPDTGFTEAAADAIFAAIVALDKALMNNTGGESGQTQGDLLDSPLHFIGFSRGTVVNSEIIQRLGTYYPNAGGVFRDDNGQVIRGDLQMTTIDPHDFDQPSLGPVFRDFKEPKVQVWENVTFADNYYQTVAPIDGTITLTPRGRDIEGSASVKLDGRAGFTEDNKLGALHSNVFAWYAGTIRFDISQINLDGRFSDQYPTEPQSYSIYDRNGEGDVGKLYGVDGSGALEPWYNQAGSSTGLGTGWFYSVLGGGKDKRPGAPTFTTPINKDNTNAQFSGGDFAVPTLFNGNFEAAFNQDDTVRNILSKELPGWSFHNSATSTPISPTDLLVDWNQVDSLTDHRNNLGISQPNYALKLEAGDSITHNRFVVPDWGVLRFDLHAPRLGNGVLKVVLKDENSTDVLNKEVNLQPALGVVLGEIKYIEDTSRVGYGNRGFETFTLNIPEEFRGETATLSFQLDGGQTVYLDNIFFKSQHLSLGNPDDARNIEDAVYSNKYLVEKPQYALSYNEEKQGANWASYQINRSWLETSSPERPNFAQDPELSFEDMVKFGDYRSSFYTAGHLTDAAIRNRETKDYVSTFLYSNTLPQALEMNSKVWASFETYLKQLAKADSREVYVITGGRGSLNEDPDWTERDTVVQAGINIPSHFWKVAIVLERPGLAVDRLSDVAFGGIIDLIAIDVSNDWRDTSVRSTDWDKWRQSVDSLESWTGLDFLSNLSDEVEERIEANKYFQPYVPPAYLLADQEWLGQQPVFTLDLSTRHNSLVDYDIIATEVHKVEGLSVGQVSTRQVGVADISTEQLSSYQFSCSQVGFSQIGPSQIGSFQNSLRQDSTSEVGFTQVGSTQIRRSDLSTAQVGTFQVSSAQITMRQIGSNQVSFSQVDLGKPNSKQVNFPQLGTTEVSFPSSIALQQFLSGHNLNVQNTTGLNWIESLWGQDLLDLSIEFKALPSGQLAETQISQFDANGSPIAGTITIDDDANSTGWFIDSTPWESSEFSTQNTAYNYQATQGSAAYGRYDLLTTLLHELAHFSGFIAGNEHFDDFVENSTFTHGDLTASITADGSHIAGNPLSLLSPYLTPGMRKLPSELELRILEAIRNNDGNAHSQGRSTVNLSQGITSPTRLQNRT